MHQRRHEATANELLKVHRRKSHLATVQNFSARLEIFRVALLLLNGCPWQGRRRPTPRLFAVGAGGVATVKNASAPPRSLRPTAKEANGQRIDVNCACLRVRSALLRCYAERRLSEYTGWAEGSRVISQRTHVPQAQEAK
jgi:hypothetical protein